VEIAYTESVPLDAERTVKASLELSGDMEVAVISFEKTRSSTMVPDSVILYKIEPNEAKMCPSESISMVRTPESASSTSNASTKKKPLVEDALTELNIVTETRTTASAFLNKARLSMYRTRLTLT